MKKRLIVVGLVISLLLNVYIYKSSNNKIEILKGNEIELKGEIFNLEDQIRESNYDLEDSNEHIEILDQAIADYESLLFLLIQNSSDIYEFINSTYQYEITYTENVRTQNIPINGKIFTTDSKVTLDFDVIKPPQLLNRGINYEFHNNNITPLIRQIDYPQPVIYEASDNHVSFEYDINIDEALQIGLTGLFAKAFGVDYKSIEVVRYDPKQHDKGSDYFPNETMKAFMVSPDMELTYDYIIDDEMLLNVGNEQIMQEYELVLTDSVLVNSKYFDENSNRIMITLLPESIFLNQHWQNDEIISVVTDMSVDIEVPAGIYNCIEVTSYENNVVFDKMYFAKGIGNVKRYIYDYTVFELNKIEKKSQ